MIRNLYEETKGILKDHGKSLSDIIWVGGRDFEIFGEDFIKLANDTYDSGYGAQEVAVDLTLVGKDFWLERHEYDGAEWWEFKTVPTRPKKKRHITRIMGGMWDTLDWMNGGKEKYS